MIFRYRAFSEELKRLFGERLDRITVDAGFTCPNVDGLKAKGGCTFCQEASYLALTHTPKTSIKDQIIKGMDYLQSRYPSRQYLVYFQTGTNTHTSAEHLKNLTEEALSFSQVKGLILATRPDCLSDSIVNLLNKLNKKTYLWVELGMPSHRDDRNQILNRAHTQVEFEKAVEVLNRYQINTSVHVILGIHGESKDEIIEKSRYFSQFPIQGIKIHNMVVFKKTVLEKQYLEGLYTPLTLEQYTDWCVTFLEYLKPTLWIQRLNAHGPARFTVAPTWSINKWTTLNAIHHQLEERQTFQGRLFSK